MVKEPGWAFLQNIQQENLDEEEGNTQLETNEDEDDKEEVLRIWTHDRKLLQIGEIKVEGEKWEDAVKAVRKAKMVDGLRKPVLVEELARRKGRRGLFEFDEDEERDGIGGGSEESGDGQVKQQQQKKEEQVWIIPFLDALQ
ncbi:MAG: casein kinase I [Watsoniomyces obsoletus]|nr:MAG: casein kinase I [Watsoniomyces obsoletus]